MIKARRRLSRDQKRDKELYGNEERWAIWRVATLYNSFFLSFSLSLSVPSFRVPCEKEGWNLCTSHVLRARVNETSGMCKREKQKCWNAKEGLERERERKTSRQSVAQHHALPRLFAFTLVHTLLSTISLAFARTQTHTNTMPGIDSQPRSDDYPNLAHDRKRGHVGKEE